MQNIKDIPTDQLSDVLVDMGLKKYAAAQLIQWLYRNRISDFDEATNLSIQARQRLKEHFFISTLKIAKHLKSVDGTEKFLWELGDGRKIESVYIPSPKRVTLCISTQVGCAIGCTFCRTAKMGLIRNLTQSEIVDQVLEVNRLMARRAMENSTENQEPITNVVFMGMGEPLHNLKPVLEAAKILINPHAVGIAKRKVTISTSGLVPGILALAKAKLGVKLALSLNGTTDEYRSQVMPINKKYPISELLTACREYISMNPRQRVTIEYVMLKGVNDSLEDAKRLVTLLSHVSSKVNLIPLNNHSKCDNEQAEEDSIDRFFRYLTERHLQVNIRANRGRDILAACGQLADL